MVLRKRAQAVVRQELSGIQHTAHDAPELLWIDQGQQQAIAYAGLSEQAHVLHKPGAVPDKPVHSAPEARQLGQEIWLDGVHREERDQADIGANPEGLERAIRQV